MVDQENTGLNHMELYNFFDPTYVLEPPAKCPNCRRDILEKTLIESAYYVNAPRLFLRFVDDIDRVVDWLFQQRMLVIAALPAG
jgi:hypothetical protein